MACKSTALLYLAILLSLGSVIVEGFGYQCGECLCDSTPGYGITAHCLRAQITSVPRNLPANLKTLYIETTTIKELNATSFALYPELRAIYVRNNTKLEHLGEYVFSQNHHLGTIEIMGNKRLRSMNARAMDGIFFKLRFIYLGNNSLEKVPDFSRMVISGTSLAPILRLDGNPLAIPSALCGDKPDIRMNADDLICNFINLSMQHTEITQLPKDMLNGTKIEILYLSHNKYLEKIDEDLFSSMIPDCLVQLVLSDNPMLTNIPSENVRSIKVFECQRCPGVKKIPPTINFESITEAHLTYPQHCCAFRKPHIQNKAAYNKAAQMGMMMCKKSQLYNKTPPPLIGNTAMFYQDSTSPSTTGFPEFTTTDYPYYFGNDSDFADLYESYDYSDYYDDYPQFSLTTIDPNRVHIKPLDEEINCTLADFQKRRENIKCYPEENSFTPCVDILEEEDYLRVTLWCVAILAVIGNLTVLIFTIISRIRTKYPMTVTKFLICNLAFSDLVQGIYLLTLAAVDAKSLGQYFNFADWWQYEGGCDVVGFITVFASELSVFTLSVITLERWYAISHAIHLTKRVQMRHAVGIMAFGWILATIVAILPLPYFQFSSYHQTSLCLPFRFDSVRDKGYIISLFSMNVGAVILVFICYASIFLQVRGSNASRASDMYLARRMALLVFTDFVCWGPVAIVAGMSAGGIDLQQSLINTESGLYMAKIVLVIFYPFNACTNPLLYAIITKQFRKDFKVTLNTCGITCHMKNKPNVGNSGGTVCRHKKLRHTASTMSNTTQMTNASSVIEGRGSSIRGRNSVDMAHSGLTHIIRPGANRVSNSNEISRLDNDMSIREYAMKILDNKSTKYSYRSRSMKRHSICGVSPMSDRSPSASTIESSESRRPSDSAKVPETLEEADSATFDDQWTETRPWESHQTRQQWHRDRWLFNEHINKQSKEVYKYDDVDSGTDVNHVSALDCELFNPDSVYSSSTGPDCVKLRCQSFTEQSNIRRFPNNRRLSRDDSYDLDSDSDCCSSYGTVAESSGRPSSNHGDCHHADSHEGNRHYPTNHIHCDERSKAGVAVNRANKSDYKTEEESVTEKLTALS